MINLVSLLSTAALLWLQCFAYEQIDEKLEMNNNLLPNDIPIVRRQMSKHYVRISSPPPETVRHLPGSTLVLKCEVAGNPAPVVNWLKNGVQITDIEENVNEIISSTTFSPAQMISKMVVRNPSNGDVFTCVGSSGVYERSASTTVIVEGDQSELLSSMIPSKPIITAWYSDILQHQGTSLTLPCRVDSNIKSQIIWVGKNGKVIYGNNRMRLLPSGDLHISNLKWSDMGGYTCTAKNALGKDTTETFLYPIALDKQY